MAHSATAPLEGGMRSPLKLIGALLVVVALGMALKTLPVNDSLLRFVAWIRDAGAVGIGIFVVAYALACVLFLPGSILTLGAGFAYGVVVGAPVVWVAANLGAVAAFLLGRTLARNWVAGRIAGNARFAAIDRAVGQQGLRIVLLTRLAPVFPFSLLNYAYGVTRVSLRDYVLGSMVGMVPGTIMYVYFGSLFTSLTELASGRPSGGTTQQIVKLVGLAVTVGVTVYVTRVAKHALAEATGEQAAAAPMAPAALTPAPYDASRPLVLPEDAHNQKLLGHVHPRGRVNPTPSGRYNLVVVGGGTAGLVSAAGAAGLGAKVALVERHLLGGDCLNVGCVPSKGLISAARVAASARMAGEFGVHTGDVQVDFAAVMERMRRLRAGIALNDGVDRFAALGVDVYLGSARFVGPHTVEVDDRTLDFGRAVIAAGARAAAPPIPGLEDAGYLTNETLFWLTALPRRLAVIGAGPIGCEMAQSFRRFGAQVALFESGAHILPREDGDAAAIVERQLAAEGVTLVFDAKVQRVERRGAEKVVHFQRDGRTEELVCDDILVGVGRAPNVDGLGLEAAGVAYDRSGVQVNDFLQTTNPHVYAAGDIASRFKFTHTADALARIVLTNALFLGRKRASVLHVPWCTYTSPEIAHVGLYEQDAVAQGLAVDTITLSLHDVDRAILEGESDGFLRVHLKQGTDTILGATLVASHAGDMISEITLAMVSGLGLSALANTIHPYPTQAEVMRKAGDAYNRTRLTPTVKKIFARWLAFRR